MRSERLLSLTTDSLLVKREAALLPEARRLVNLRRVIDRNSSRRIFSIHIRRRSSCAIFRLRIGEETIAMDLVGRLLLAVLLISASSCTVQGEVTRYWAQYYITRGPVEGFTPVFRPLSTENIKNKGFGWVMHDSAMHTSGGYPIGSEGGMVWYHSPTQEEQVTTVTFSTNLDGMWKGSSLNYRGLWKRPAEGNKPLAPKQELAIVGGHGGLKGASGSVYYTLVQEYPEKYYVRCDIFIDVSRNSMRHTLVDFDALYKNRTESVHDSPETTESDDVLKQVTGSS